MSFLAPLFLIGALAISLPVIFHLIRRTTRERTLFSSLMFLAPSPPRLTRRSRLEHLLLLALRCAVLALLALGFARPFLKQATVSEPTADEARRLVILIDDSASMRRANLWPEAIERAKDILRQTGPADEVAVCLFGRRLEPLVSFEEWRGAAAGQRAALAEGKLAQASPGWESTDVGSALLGAAELLEEAAGKGPARARQMVLISDLQEGSRLQSLQGYEWPNGIRLSIEPLKARRTGNAALHLVTDSDPAAPADPGSARVRVSNDRASRLEQFQVGWALADGRSFAGEPVRVYVPAGQSRIFNLSGITNRAEELTMIVLRGDEEPFDNTAYRVPPRVSQAKVVYLGKDSTNDPQQPGYYVSRAFRDSRRQDVEVISRPKNGSFPEPELRAAALYVTDWLSAEEAALAREQVAEGKTLVYVLRNQAAAVALGQLLQSASLPMEEVKPTTYAMLGEIDFRHPLFSAFADPRYSDFTRIYFWRYRRVDLGGIAGARAVAKFDSGDPALFEVPLGKGKVLVFTSGWQPEDSQLALSTKFVPLLAAMLEQSMPPALPFQYQVGDTIPLAGNGSEEPAVTSVVPPGGAALSLNEGQTNFAGTKAPGIYVLSGGAATKRVAVNLDPGESRLTPLASDEFERLGAPVAAATSFGPKETPRTVRLRNAELESRQKLWRWLIVAALGFIVAETWLAGRTARGLRGRTGTSTASTA